MTKSQIFNAKGVRHYISHLFLPNKLFGIYNDKKIIGDNPAILNR